MIYLIIIIVTIVLVRFIFATNKQASQIKKQGGMRNKYRVLINKILNSNQRCKVLNETNNSIAIGLTTIDGSTLFEIIQTFGRVTIQWRVNSSVYGTHDLDWNFDEFLDQNKMIEKIENDLSQYQSNVYSSP